MFVEISRNFRAGTLARSFGTQLARSSGNAAPRGSLFILLHAKASRGHPPWPCGRRGTFFEDFRPAGRFFSNQQIPRLCRTLAGESRTGRFRRRSVIYFPKAVNGAAGYQHLERGANDMVSNICSSNSFSTERVLLLSAENACRT